MSAVAQLRPRHNPTLLRAYIEENASLPPDCILGNLAWFSVEEAPYEHQLIEDGFDKFRLAQQFLPTPINPADAYEKATKDVHGFKYSVALSDGTTGEAEIMIREVLRNDKQMIRHIIREVRDSQARRLDYAKVGEFVFYRPITRADGKIDPGSARCRTSLDPGLTVEEYTLLSDLVTRFDEAFDRFRNYYDGQRIRKIFRDYLLFLNAIQMKPSVYFVHATRSDELERLSEFAATLGTASLTLWQLPDLPHLRTEVVNTFQKEAEEDLSDVVKAIAKLRATRVRGISPEAWLHTKRQYDAVMIKAGEYGRTLQISQDRTAAAAEIALEALVALKEDMLAAMDK